MMWESAPLSPTVLQPSNLVGSVYNPAQGACGTAGAGGLQPRHERTTATALPSFQAQGTRRGGGSEEL